MKNLVILTNSFPYQGGEQFIESEVHYWDKTAFDNVYILPNTAPTQNVRFYPESLILYPGVNTSVITKIIYIVMALISFIFWRELCGIFRTGEIKLKNILVALKTVTHIKLKEKQLSNVLNIIQGDIVIYSYWNDVDFYAAGELKKKKNVQRVISRAHGFDCYKERRINGYMPLKRQYSNVVDKVFLLTDSAKKYYHETYNYSEDKLEVAKLGVFLPTHTANYNLDRKVIKVLSISNCIAIKRVDKIIEALNQFSSSMKVEIHWTHIGNGVLLEKLKQQALETQIIGKNNFFKYNFMGFLPNIEVKTLLCEQNFDLFINASESEGVPVSIMEAMSYSIPVIAPDVGGISDIVNNSTGMLLNSNPSILDFVDAIQKIYYSKDYLKYREYAFLMVKNNYNADKNYRKFMSSLERLL